MVDYCGAFFFTVPCAVGKICIRMLRNTCHGSQCRSSQIKTQSLTYFRSLLYFHTSFTVLQSQFHIFKERCALIGRHHSTLRATQSAWCQTFLTSVLYVDTPRLLDVDIICSNRPVQCDGVMRTTETHLLLHFVLGIVATALLQNTLGIYEHPFASVAWHRCRQEIGLKVSETNKKENKCDTRW